MALWRPWGQVSVCDKSTENTCWVLQVTFRPWSLNYGMHRKTVNLNIKCEELTVASLMNNSQSDSQGHGTYWEALTAWLMRLLPRLSFFKSLTYLACLQPRGFRHRQFYSLLGKWTSFNEINLFLKAHFVVLSLSLSVLSNRMQEAFSKVGPLSANLKLWDMRCAQKIE